MTKWWKNIGPGTLVAAAFIGPGTITVCTQAGVQFGYALLWAMLISIISTIVLQEMSARIGLVKQEGLSAVLRTAIENKIIRNIALLLIIGAIIVGNAAYEAGNISGGVLGMQSLFPGMSTISLVLLLGGAAFCILFLGNYKWLEKILVSLVITMSLAFLITAILTKPDIKEIFAGLFSFQSPEGSLLTVLALVGTTVVPYNLFLHANLVKEKWSGVENMNSMQFDTRVSIILGGLVSMGIIMCAIPLQGTAVKGASDLAEGLRPLLGEFSKVFMAIGLFAAGLTSAITAPLAAAYVANGCFNWQAGMKDWRFRAVWILILGLGVLFSSLGFKPIKVIQFAQIANGMLLPVIAMLLLWMVNQSNILGKYKNSMLQNVIAFAVVAFSIFLGAKGIWKVLF